MSAERLTRSLLVASLLAKASILGADLFPEETAYRGAFEASKVGLTGRVVDSSGAPLSGCNLRLESGESSITASDGTYVITGLSRSNQLLTVSAAGYYPQLLPVQLFVPMAQTNLLLPPVVLWPDTPSVVRFLFGGDTAFARRMLNPEESAARDQMPMDNPDALIRVSDPLPGTLGVVDFIKPLFLAADYPVVNFESVVTLDPSTPHWQKAFVYFTLPGSLPALKSLNINRTKPLRGSLTVIRLRSWLGLWSCPSDWLKESVLAYDYITPKTHRRDPTAWILNSHPRLVRPFRRGLSPILSSFSR